MHRRRRGNKRERERGREYYVYSIEPDILWCHPRQTVLFATGQEGNPLTFCQLDRDNGKPAEKRIRRLGVTVEGKLLLIDVVARVSIPFHSLNEQFSSKNSSPFLPSPFLLNQRLKEFSRSKSINISRSEQPRQTNHHCSLNRRRLKRRKERKKKERERSETYQGDPSPTPNNFLISPLTGNKRAIEAFATFYILDPPP